MLRIGKVLAVIMFCVACNPAKKAACVFNSGHCPKEVVSQTETVETEKVVEVEKIVEVEKVVEVEKIVEVKAELTYVAKTVSIETDRNLHPWHDNNFVQVENDSDIIIKLKSRYSFSSLPENENGGWIDIKIGDVTYCYQGAFGKKYYDFSYKKLEDADTGCDLNNDKSIDGLTELNVLKSGERLQIIPRAPKMNVGTYEWRFEAIEIIRSGE